jgi:crotonobetainyl-CoA:carnitine CoA-transferase CaiB-like acyl-CoA transferase
MRRRSILKLTSTISSPIQVQGIAKVRAKRAPEIGEHNEEVLKQLGCDADAIEALRASGAISRRRENAA